MSAILVTIKLLGVEATLAEEGGWQSASAEVASLLNAECRPGENPHWAYDPDPIRHAADRAAELFGATLVRVDDEEEPDIEEGAVH
jgi:hypothetical protein